MSNKFKLSKNATDELHTLSAALNLRRNIVCRIALGCSLSMEDAIETCDEDSDGQEFNKSTIIGTDEFVLVAMITNQCGHTIDLDNFFNEIVRANIIRGLSTLSMLYSHINSPVEFMGRLCGFNGEELIG